LLEKIIAAVSTETESYRLWLDVFPENTRTRRAYEAAGF
jgi:RimJ/RimL family protein N-acetyltransferase